MNRNYMREVAKILGVELGEKFEIKDAAFNPYYIGENGLHGCDGSIREMSLNNLLTGVATIKKFILDDKEREYLASVIAPKSIYKNVDYIVKNQIGKYFRIVIIDKQGVHSHLPCFANDNMYKGMEIGTIYTLQELGLSRDE